MVLLQKVPQRDEASTLSALSMSRLALTVSAAHRVELTFAVLRLDKVVKVIELILSLRLWRREFILLCHLIEELIRFLV